MSTIAHSLDRNATTTVRSRTGLHSASPAAALPSAARLGAALSVLRVVVGTVFLAHGAQKLFVFGFAGVIGAFEGMGVPLAGISGPAVALLELVGGVALIAGIFTRVVALGLAIEMLGAIVLVHASAGFFLPNGLEFALTLLGGVVALALVGPGPYSLGVAVTRRRMHG